MTHQSDPLKSPTLYFVDRIVPQVDERVPARRCGTAMTQCGQGIGLEMMLVELGAQPIPGTRSARCAMQADDWHSANATPGQDLDAVTTPDASP